MKNRLLIKVVSLVLILTMVVPAVAMAATEKDSEEIWGIFSERSNFKNIKAWYGEEGTEPVVSEDPLGWELKFRTGVTDIYIDVADRLMYDLNGEAVEIEVDYFDEGEGVFTLSYDGYERVDDDAEYVDLTDTKKWKTHTFFIQDPRFKNGLNDADFKITVKSTFLSSANSYSVRDDIVFGAVRVKKASVISPIQMKLTTDATGNIFFEDEKIKFNVDYTNKLKEEYNLNAHVEAIDIENRLVWEDNHEITFGKEEKLSKTYEFDIDRFNLYWLRVTLTDDEGKIFCIKDAEFYYVTTNHGKRLNPDVSTTTHLEYRTRQGDYTKVVPLLINAGYGRTRYDLSWLRVYSGSGGYGLSPYQKSVLESFKKAGIKTTIIVSIQNERYPLKSRDIAYAAGTPTPEFLKDFREHVQELVRMTKDYAEAYIIGNEVELATQPEHLKYPESYVQWAEIAYTEIKKAYPEAKVLGYGLTLGDKAWFEKTIELGAHNYFDQADVHPYAVFKSYEQQDFIGRIESYWNSAKEKYGVDLGPVWIGETGYFHLRHGGMSAYEISQQFPRLYIYSAASDMIDTVVDYALVSTGPESYGHIRGADPGGARDYDLPYAPFREYLTIACWNKNFGGDSDFVDSVDGQNTRIYRFKRRSDGKDFAALWSLDGKENITLDLGTNEISYMDILGNEDKMYSDDGRYTFNLSEDMKYIIGNFSEFEICDEQKYDFGAEELEVIEGTPEAISVTVDGGKPEDYTISTTDLMKAKTSYIGKDGDSLTLGVTMETPKEDYTQKYLCGEVGRSQFKLFNKDNIRDVVSVDVMKDGKLYSRCEIPLTEINPVTIKCELLPKSIQEVNNWQTTYILQNRSAEMISGSFNILEPIEIAQNTEPVSIDFAPGEIVELPYSVPAELVGQELVLKAEFVSKDGTSIEYEDKKDTFCAVYTDTPPTIDAALNADEWNLDAKGKMLENTWAKLIETESYTGADDLSGTVNMMWDKDNLYLAVDVKDNIHKQAYKDGGTWKADGLQLGFTAGENPTAWTAFRLALSDDGNIYKYLASTEDGSYASGAVSDDDMDLAVKREEGRTIYEMRISWKLIMPLLNAVQVGDGNANAGVIVNDEARKEAKSGEAIRFSVLVNDDDGGGRKGYVEYGTGVSGGAYKNFSTITLFGGNE